MGCDIHLYFEKKNKQGIWEKIEIDERIIPRDRYYHLFSFLADVRSYGEFKCEPQFANRGIPKDSSCPGLDDESEDFWIGDHSFTHAYLDEILESPWEKYELQDSYFIIFCEYVLPRLCCFCGVLSKEEEKNIRVIMGFDN
jgi:hypothetical protein